MDTLHHCQIDTITPKANVYHQPPLSNGNWCNIELEK